MAACRERGDSYDDSHSKGVSQGRQGKEDMLVKVPGYKQQNPFQLVESEHDSKAGYTGACL